MSVFRGLVGSDGKLRVAQLSSAVVPAGAVQRRGLWVSVDDAVLGILDTGGNRIFQGGLAFDEATGLLLISNGAAAGSIPMDGMMTDVNGALFLKEGGQVDVIHQGVGMTDSPPGGIVEYVREPLMTFYARLEAGTADSKGDAGVFDRSSSGTYLDRDGILRSVGSDEARFGGSYGLMLEPASTNKCENWNANPDVALTGLDHQLGGSMARVLDEQEILDAKLDRVATSGYVVELEAVGDASASLCYIDGATGNTTDHVCSVYARALVGSGKFGLSSGAGLVSFSNAKYERLTNKSTPTSAGNRFYILADPGARIRFILNQLEEQYIASSPIITRGAAATRALDKLRYPLGTPSFLNQSAGMLAMLWRPGFSNSDLPNASVGKRLISLNGVDSIDIFLNYQKSSDTVDSFLSRQNNVNQTVTVVGTLQANTDYLLLVRWGSATRQVGYKQGGTTRWATAVAHADWATDGWMRLEELVNPKRPLSQDRDLYVWAEDKGTEWLETYFSGVAN